MIEAKGIYFSYGRSTVLDDVSLSLEKGKITGLLGPNGSGKTTLLKCLCALLRPQSGEITVGGKNIRSFSPREAARLIAYLPQDHSPSFPYLGQEIVMMGTTPHLDTFSFGPGKRELSEAKRVIEYVGIGHLSERPYTDLSGGERQLILLARAIVQNAKLLILDEPTLNLDLKNQISIFDIIGRLSKENGVTVLFSTHDPNQILRYCDAGVLLSGTKLIASGDPKDIVTEKNILSVFGVKADFVGTGDRTAILPFMIP